MADKVATILDVKKYFGYGTGEAAQFRQEWDALSDKDKADLKNGIGNGTLTY
jgi:hypothetical protein